MELMTVVYCLQFIQSIKDAYPDNNVSVTINSVVSGSVVVNETTTFLDGDTSAASSQAQRLATAPATIFPDATYGPVTTSTVNSSEATNPAGESDASEGFKACQCHSLSM